MKNLNERSVRILASLGLILTTMIWGFAFVVMKNSVDLIPPTYLLAIRFSMSAVLLALLFHKNLFAADCQTILCGAILGIFLCQASHFLKQFRKGAHSVFDALPLGFPVL